MALGIIGLVLRPAVAVAQQNPRITITVYNRSRMEASTLTAGQLIAREVLRRAGVDSIWISCPVLNSLESDPECRERPSPTRLVVTIVPNWGGQRLGPSALGLALQVEEGFGSYCYIFQEHLDQLVAAAHINPARLLGSAMAHEIGHLLKGSNSHSPRGLMSAQWHVDELHAAAVGSLNFTAADAALMRTRLAQVSEEERSPTGQRN
jgi:hypothetical protein